MVIDYSASVRRVFTRAAVWSLIGMLYAPLYVVLHQLLAPALSAYAAVLAAAAAGGIGAAFYGARHLALTASVVGVLGGTGMLLAFGQQAAIWQVAGFTALLGLVVGAVIDFPQRCTANVGIKFLIGAGASALSGLLLSAVALIAGVALPMAAAVALLVSVTGVLYVAALGFWCRSNGLGGGRPRFCSVVEGIVIAVIASITAMGLAAFAGIFADQPAGVLTNALTVASGDLPVAVLGGVMAGAVTGGLLELFEFAWVDVT
jgi:hypothetical protein